MATAAAPDRLTPADLARCFQGPIPPVRTTLGYKLGLLLSAVVLVVLPLAYLGLTALVGWGTWQWATGASSILTGGGSAYGKLLVYFTPLIAGCSVIVFMLKPFFAPEAERVEPEPLRRGEAPALFALVDQVAATVGSPRPNRIFVDDLVNASAGFRGFAGMLRRDLQLTIGLPLLHGMTAQQLTGVVAHELGHFGQGMGMSLTYVVRSTSAWMLGLIHGRDGFDAWLERQAAEASSLWAQVMVGGARLCVWLTRRVLQVFVFFGQLCTSYLLRQMEYDADRYEARVAGSRQWAPTSLRLLVLGHAQAVARRQVEEGWREARLPDDVHGLTARQAERFDERTLLKIREHQLDAKTGWLDTHPCDRARIASAEREGAPGVFRLEAPASALVERLGELSRRATIEWYEFVLGREPRKEELVPLDEYFGERQAEEQAADELAQWLPATGSRAPRVELEGLPAPRDPQAALEGLRDAHRRMSEQAELAAAHGEAFSAAGQLLVKHQLARALSGGGLAELAKSNGLPVDEPVIEAMGRSARSKREEAESRLADWDGLLQRRVECALELLQHPKVAERVPDSSERLEEMSRVLPALARSSRLAPSAAGLGRGLVALGAVFQAAESSKDPDALEMRAREICESLAEHLGRIRSATRGTVYPFRHSAGEVDLADQLVPEVPPVTEFGAVYRAAGAAAEGLGQLHHRCASRVAAACAAVEKACGIGGGQEAAEGGARGAGTSPGKAGARHR